MKKYLFGMIAFATLFVACNPHGNEISIDAKSLVGKWKLVLTDDAPVLTDNRIIYTFNEDKTGTQTLSKDLDNIGERAWYMQQSLSYTLNGNALHTQWTKSTVVMEWLASVYSVKNDYFIADPSRVLLQTQPLENMPKTTWKRIRTDYSSEIVGLWEGISCEGITYGDWHHRWLYLPGGKYYYFSQDTAGGTWNGKWIISENSLNEYDVDGDYLACRWRESEVAKEDREFWDISIRDKNMRWDALREDERGSFNASFDMHRLSPTLEEVQQYIIGKWIAVEEDGMPIQTNRKSVHTFDTSNKVFYTVADTTKTTSEWHNHLELNYSLQGAYLVESGKDNTGKLVQWRSSLAQMTNSEMLTFAFTSSRELADGQPFREIKFKKVDVDYSEAVVGLWEGIAGGGDYGDYNHRWEYLEDGSYNYYNPDGHGGWELADSNDGQYMVDGNWMATRWTNNGINYEWWDLDIQGDIMLWTGLRANGETNTFTLKRVTE